MAGGETDFVIERASAPSLICLFAVAAAGHLALFPNVADLDGFYHLGHARAYLEGSLFDTALPWATRSIIGSTGGDLWWGFHVLSLPFGALGDVALGLRLFAVMLTLLLGSTVWWVLRRHGVPGAAWWAALFLVAVPNVFFRHLMVRPHVVSLAASIALLSVLVRGRWWHVLLLATLMSWVHLSLFWMAPCIAIAYAVVRIPMTVAFGPEDPDTGVPIRRAVPAAVAGSLLGWLLRPDAGAAASLLNVQLLQLFALKAAGQPLTFSAELSPIGILELLRTTWTFAAAWIVAVALVAFLAMRGTLARLGQSRVTMLVTSGVISLTFLALALLSARRAMEQWVSFGFLLLPLLAMLLPRRGHPEPAPGRRRRVVVTAVVAAFVTGHLVWAGQRHLINAREVAFPADKLAAVARYLDDNAGPGDVVFHTRWDNFGPLFAHSRSTRYLGGMDPIFQFAFDQRSYWEFFYLSADITTEWTCDGYPCAQAIATDTHRALREHFGARWVVVEPSRNPRFALYLLNDPRYALALETRTEALFEILDPGPEGD